MGRISAILDALALSLPGCPSTSGTAALDDSGPLTIAKQGSFFMGGRNIRSSDLSVRPAYAPSGTITVDQMYVHYQIPANAGKKKPVVFIRGCCLTNKPWEETPDGRMGWDELFVRRGHSTYVVDQTAGGRSAADPSGIVRVKGKRAAASALPLVVLT